MYITNRHMLNYTEALKRTNNSEKLLVENAMGLNKLLLFTPKSELINIVEKYQYNQPNNVVDKDTTDYIDKAVNDVLFFDLERMSNEISTAEIDEIIFINTEDYAVSQENDSENITVNTADLLFSEGDRVIQVLMDDELLSESLLYSMGLAKPYKIMGNLLEKKLINDNQELYVMKVIAMYEHECTEYIIDRFKRRNYTYLDYERVYNITGIDKDILFDLLYAQILTTDKRNNPHHFKILEQIKPERKQYFPTFEEIEYHERTKFPFLVQRKHQIALEQMIYNSLKEALNNLILNIQNDVINEGDICYLRDYQLVFYNRSATNIDRVVEHNIKREKLVQKDDNFEHDLLKQAVYDDLMCNDYHFIFVGKPNRADSIFGNQKIIFMISTIEEEINLKGSIYYSDGSNRVSIIGKYMGNVRGNRFIDNIHHANKLCVEDYKAEKPSFTNVISKDTPDDEEFALIELIAVKNETSFG